MDEKMCECGWWVQGWKELEINGAWDAWLCTKI